MPTGPIHSSGDKFYTAFHDPKTCTSPARDKIFPLVTFLRDYCKVDEEVNDQVSLLTDPEVDLNRMDNDAFKLFIHTITLECYEKKSLLIMLYGKNIS
jgi:hypothetical protein